MRYHCTYTARTRFKSIKAQQRIEPNQSPAAFVHALAFLFERPHFLALQAIRDQEYNCTLAQDTPLPLQDTPLQLQDTPWLLPVKCSQRLIAITVTHLAAYVRTHLREILGPRNLFGSKRKPRINKPSDSSVDNGTATGIDIGLFF